LQQTPDELARTLHGAASALIDREAAGRDAYQKREEQYIQAFEQIEAKLLKLARMPAAQTGASLGAERKRVIDSISAALKNLAPIIGDLEKAVAERDAAISAAAEKYTTFENDVRVAMQLGLSVNVPESCLRKLESIKQAYEREIAALKGGLEAASTDYEALVLRISGIANKQGSVYEMLSRVQDEREGAMRERKRMLNLMNEYRSCLEALGQLLLTDDNLAEMTIDEIVSALVALCKNPRAVTVACSWVADTFAPVWKYDNKYDRLNPHQYLPRMAARLAEFLAFEESFMPLQGIMDCDPPAIEEAFNQAKIQIGGLAVPTGMEKAFRTLLALLDHLELPCEALPEETWETEEEEDNGEDGNAIDVE
jgi:chromosome segregation ATPase